MRNVEIYVDEAVAIELNLAGTKYLDPKIFEKKFDSLVGKIYSKFPNLKTPIDAEFSPEREVAKIMFPKQDAEEVLVYSGEHDVILHKGEHIILSKKIADSINKCDKNSSDAFSEGDEYMVTNVSRYIDKNLDKYTLGSYIIKDEPIVINLDKK